MAQQQDEWVDVEEDDWEDVSPVTLPKSTTTKSKADRSWYDTVFSAPEFITDAVGDVPEGGFFDAIKAVPDVARGLWNNPLETIGGGLKGMVQGAATQLSPANVISTAVPFIKPLKAAAPMINAGLGAGQIAQGVSDVIEGDTGTGLGNIGFGALGVGTAGLPKFGKKGLSKVADSVNSPELIPNDIIPPVGNIIERNGVKYKQTGVNPDTGNPTYEPFGPNITNAEVKREIPQKEIPKQIENSINELNNELDVTPPEMKEGLYRKVSGTIKTLLTSYDMSAPGRQGKGLITHPEFWKSLNGMRKSWGSQKAFDIVQDSIVNDSSGYFKPSVNPQGKAIKSYAEQVGLDLTDLVSNREEVFKSRVAEKYLPGVQASQRAYVAFLNKTRADVFKKLINQAKKEGRDPTLNLQIGRDIANSINVSTGRGSFGKLEESATAMKTLNEIFFAPKLAASRVQMYTRVLNPKTYTQSDPIVRKEALRSLFGIVGTATMVGELARLGGAQVSNDPTNTDFRKIKIGNTRIDNLAGLQQYGVSTARLLAGKLTSSTSGKTFDLTNPKFGGPMRADIVTNFLTNKLAPIPSLVWAWMNTKEFDGTPFEMKQALVNRTVPIIMQDLYELAKEDPSLLPLGVLPFFGEGIQTYGR